jgi:hypothetical protein
MVVSCIFNGDLTLQNDSPDCLNCSAIQKVLAYPDSFLCELNIADRNDTGFFLSIAPCTDSTKTECQVYSPWPGSYKYLANGYETKKLSLFFPTDQMGAYSGTLVIQDASNAKLFLPYTVNKMFIDSFDSPQVSNQYWQYYNKNDSEHVVVDNREKKLMFSFKAVPDSLDKPQCTGIRSVFQVSDSLETSVQFKLRDDVDSAFEIDFFISSSPDTGKWDGEKAGIFISGQKNRLRLVCKSIYLQNKTFETDIVSGKMGIFRSDTRVTYYFGDGTSSKNLLSGVNYYFPRDVPVFIHLKMSVTNQSKDHYCYWNDFTITKGVLGF